MTAKQFGKLLRKVGLSQRQLALRLGVDTTTVNRWARDRGPIPEAVALLLECWAEQGGPPAREEQRA